MSASKDAQYDQMLAWGHQISEQSELNREMDRKNFEIGYDELKIWSQQQISAKEAELIQKQQEIESIQQETIGALSDQFEAQIQDQAAEIDQLRAANKQLQDQLLDATTMHQSAVAVQEEIVEPARPASRSIRSQGLDLHQPRKAQEKTASLLGIISSDDDIIAHEVDNGEEDDATATVQIVPSIGNASEIEIPWQDQIKQIDANIMCTILLSKEYQMAYKSTAKNFDKSFFFKHRNSGVKHSREAMTELEQNIDAACKKIKEDFLRQLMSKIVEKQQPNNEDINQYNQRIGNAIIKAVEQQIKQEKFSSYTSHSFRAYLHALHNDLTENAGLITSKTEARTSSVIEARLVAHKSTERKMNPEK